MEIKDLVDLIKFLLLLLLASRASDDLQKYMKIAEIYKKELANIVKYTNIVVRERNRLFHEQRNLRDNKSI